MPANAEGVDDLLEGHFLQSLFSGCSVRRGAGPYLGEKFYGKNRLKTRWIRYIYYITRRPGRGRVEKTRGLVMQKAIILIAGEILKNFEYSFSHGQEIEYEYYQGTVRFNQIKDARGNNSVTMYSFHKAIEKGQIERRDEE